MALAEVGKAGEGLLIGWPTRLKPTLGPEVVAIGILGWDTVESPVVGVSRGLRGKLCRKGGQDSPLAGKDDGALPDLDAPILVVPLRLVWNA